MIQYRSIVTVVLILPLFGVAPAGVMAQGTGAASVLEPQTGPGAAPPKKPLPEKAELPGSTRPAAAKVDQAKPNAKAGAKVKSEAEVKAKATTEVKAKAKATEVKAEVKDTVGAKAKAPPAPPAAPVAPVAPQLIVASWNGGYGQAQDRAILTPFAAAARIKVIRRKHGGAGFEFETPADVVDVSAAAAAAGCKSGALMALDDLELAPSPRGKQAADDFLDGGRMKCGIASMAWSHVILVNRNGFKRRVPKRLKHVFNLRRYPGRRAFVKQPRYLLEMALMADGAEPGDVYALLDTYAGVKRALAKLASLWGSIIWLDKPGDAYDALKSGGAVITGGFSGRAFRTVMADPGTSVIWDGQIYHVDYWAIPKTTSNLKAARKFVRFATAPEQLAANARQFPYGPMRRSAVAMAGRHALLGVDLAPHLPTSPRNMRRALRHNTAWWAENGAMMSARFERWLEMETAKREKKQKRRRRRTRRRQR